jgi:RimJ/RimL family protein N-acetyltransferase
MDYLRPFSIEDIHESERRATEEGHPFIVDVDGNPVGRIGLNNFRPRDRMASLYVFIGEEDARGKGYGRDALMTLLIYAFDALNLRQVELWTLADNDRAIRLYKGCGFVEDGRLRDRSWIDGHYIDHLVMSVNAEEFARVRTDLGR